MLSEAEFEAADVAAAASAGGQLDAVLVSPLACGVGEVFQVRVSGAAVALFERGDAVELLAADVVAVGPAVPVVERVEALFEIGDGSSPWVDDLTEVLEKLGVIERVAALAGGAPPLDRRRAFVFDLPGPVVAGCGAARLGTVR